jgi:hypothetical protein
MASSQYAMILKDLETIFKCPLTIDSNNSCLINLNKLGIKVQVEENRYGDLMIAVRLGVIPGSRYRDNLFKEALKSNRTNPSTGVFGFSKLNSDLVVFLIVNKRAALIDNFNTILPPFLEKAKKWAEAIEQGTIPLREEVSKPTDLGIFGMVR